MSGKLIVFEGADGSGKATQSKLLLNYLGKKQIPVEFISFPRYKSSLWGELVRRYLSGEFGKVDEVSPYLASVLYAGDRMGASPQIKKWLNAGKMVICDRYVGSNIAHQVAKLQTPNAKLQFIKWLEDLEYGENKIPKEDLVIFLSVPVEVSQKLMDDRRKDIHERDADYLRVVAKEYESLARERKNWVKINCVVNGKLLLPAAIHQKVLEVLKGKYILRT
ncbi:dTMP kinase [Candidatus Curtissbacteria bacterium RIFCSPLOWO2_02_41_11]|uniref:Thymidylate kinase n=2 Tax=Candidatus Curtissiibacteriota TaxID=1752717 RepID=A0A1F5HPA3_9BACT|nr:MAG: Thymidylate kinase [Candidatus Curtissbacteria bacterium GW2011_GWA2_41_24]OGD89994.1 MAG: dTMP kinase [Candidatus Curtissbacteria bacterium RIFCSPHIGHO2_02_39_8]OGE05974.1 MAG: dTMP kinase [Candidatus Curtissbacteria bacterium RIFCSPLOWO2_02_41_11]